MAFGRKLSCFKLGDICGERVRTFCKKKFRKTYSRKIYSSVWLAIFVNTHGHAHLVRTPCTGWKWNSHLSKNGRTCSAEQGPFCTTHIYTWPGIELGVQIWRGLELGVHIWPGLELGVHKWPGIELGVHIWPGLELVVHILPGIELGVHTWPGLEARCTVHTWPGLELGVQCTWPGIELGVQCTHWSLA